MTPRLDAHRWLAVWALAAIVYLCFLPWPVEVIGNERSHHLTVRALLERGTFELVPPLRCDYARSAGHYYSNKPPGLPLLLLPAGWLGLQAGGGADLVALFFMRVAIALLSALGVGLLYRNLRALGAGERGALAGAAMLGFGTIHFVYAGTLMVHSVAASCVMLLLGFVIAFREQGRVRDVLGAALSGGYGVLLDYNFAFVLVPLYLLLGWDVVRSRSRAAIAAWALAPLLPAGALGAYHYAAFGTPFATGYDRYVGPDWVKFEGFTGEGTWTGGLLGPLFGLTFSLERGMFVYTPLLLLAPWALRRGVTGAERHRALFAVMLGAAALTLLVVAKSSIWHSGHAFGPRYLHLAMSLLVVLAALVLEPWLERRALRVAAYVALGWSVALHALLSHAWTNGNNWAIWIVRDELDRQVSVFEAVWPRWLNGDFGDWIGPPAYLVFKGLVAAAGLAWLARAWRLGRRALATWGAALTVAALALTALTFTRAEALEARRARVTAGWLKENQTRADTLKARAERATKPRPKAPPRKQAARAPRPRPPVPRGAPSKPEKVTVERTE